ncbi:MAG TPA: antibiotic biosynthesis monooxygenase [Trebonia sp.]|nr:antibiotic biosynthesis monooxygenase [Trebonia sp.]
MWGKRQRADDWDGDQGNQPSEDRRDQRSDDRRGDGYWNEPNDWAAGNGNHQGFGEQGFGNDGRRGFGDEDRQGFGQSPWGQQRRARGDYPEGGPFGEQGFGEQGFGEPAFGEPGFGGARQDSWPSEPRRPMRDFPEAGRRQQSTFGGRGGDFGAPDGGRGGDVGGRGGDFGAPDGGRGGDFGAPDLDHRDLDRRDGGGLDRREGGGLDRRDGGVLDRREGGGQWNDAGGWGQAEPEVSVPVFTPAGQASPAVPGAIATTGASTRPYGRLSIFTLLDDRAAEFDRLAEQAAEGVSMHEPDTLVYVMHVVPKAPMQRIIYEIYRDHAAFENHQRQPHILDFEEGRRGCVLVTNIIDLRLKYAKVAPLQGATQQPAGRPQLPASPSQPGPGARHRAQQPGEPEGGWFSDSPGGRGADPEGSDWGPDRSFGGGDRRSQDWGQPQYSGQRYRDN